MWCISCYIVDCMIFVDFVDLMKKFMSFEKQRFFLLFNLWDPRNKLFSCTQIIIITPIIWGVFTLIKYTYTHNVSIILGWNSWNIQPFNSSDEFHLVYYCSTLWSRHFSEIVLEYMMKMRTKSIHSIYGVQEWR